MEKVSRFGVSFEEPLLKELDRIVKKNKFSNRSQALRSLIREKVVENDWVTDEDVAGTITLVYRHDHHGLMDKLTSAQHRFHHLIISTQHIHLNHDSCLEVIVVKGKPSEAKRLLDSLRTIKGVKYGALSMAAAADRLP